MMMQEESLHTSQTYIQLSSESLLHDCSYPVILLACAPLGGMQGCLVSLLVNCNRCCTKPCIYSCMLALLKLMQILALGSVTEATSQQ